MSGSAEEEGRRRRGQLFTNTTNTDTNTLSLRESSTVSADYSRAARRLRRVLAALCIAVLLLLAGLLATVCMFYWHDTTLLERARYTGLSRFYVICCIWSASLASSSATTSSAIWDDVRADLTQLRRVSSAIMYDASPGRFARMTALMKRPLFSHYYATARETEVVGLWRAGELFSSSIESLIFAESSAAERSGARAKLAGNEMAGAAAAYSASLNAYVEQLQAELRSSTVVVTALFVGALCLLALVMFAVRRHLARTEGTRLSVLGLFRLSPRHALRVMIAKMNHRLESFDELDPAFARMLRSRGLLRMPADKEERQRPSSGDSGGEGEEDGGAAPSPDHPAPAAPTAETPVARGSTVGAGRPRASATVAGVSAASSSGDGGSDVVARATGPSMPRPTSSSLDHDTTTPSAATTAPAMASSSNGDSSLNTKHRPGRGAFARLAKTSPRHC